MVGRGRPRRNQENNSNNQPDSDANVLNQILATLTQLVQNQGNQHNELERRQTTPENVKQLGTEEDKALERFQKFNPPKFLGEPEDEKAELWLEDIENIFTTLRYDDERKVSYAVFQLQGAAREWWRMVQEKWTQENTPRVWENFIREFNEEYFPPVVREKREEEFISLRQGNMNVAQYAAKFKKLMKFAKNIVDTEERKIRKFVKGLRNEVQDAMIASEIHTYAKAVELAAKVEKRKDEQKTQGQPSSDDLSYEERPIKILDYKSQELRNRSIPLVKVLWSHHGIEEATWEKEDEMRQKYAFLFDNPGKISRTKFL